MIKINEGRPVRPPNVWGKKSKIDQKFVTLSHEP